MAILLQLITYYILTIKYSISCCSYFNASLLVLPRKYVQIYGYIHKFDIYVH